MANFKEIIENTGVTVKDLFMAVGLHGSNLVSLEDAQGLDLKPADSNKLELNRVTKENVGHISRILKDQFKSLPVSDDDAKTYLKSMLERR